MPLLRSQIGLTSLIECPLVTEAPTLSDHSKSSQSTVCCFLPSFARWTHRQQQYSYETFQLEVDAYE